MSDAEETIQEVDIKQGLNKIMDSMLESIDNENMRSFIRFSDNPAIESAKNCIKHKNTEHFYYLFMYPLMKPIDGLMELSLPGNRKAQFLFLHSQFVESHYENIINKIEGYPCCADKARTIMNRLATFLVDGKEINFNYDQEYTYHLPKKVFTDHDSIINFFNAIHELFYGKSDKYITAIHDVYCEEKRDAG